MKEKWRGDSNLPTPLCTLLLKTYSYIDNKILIQMRQLFSYYDNITLIFVNPILKYKNQIKIFEN